jgi:hypothetical protein
MSVKTFDCPNCGAPLAALVPGKIDYACDYCGRALRISDSGVPVNNVVPWVIG